jgi:hypothetical protein
VIYRLTVGSHGPPVHLGLITCTERPAGSRTYADYDDATVELIPGARRSLR